MSRRTQVRLRVGVLALVVAVLLGACGQAGDDAGGSSQPQGAALRVRLGTQEFPEGRILGELWRQALAVNGYTVDLRKGVGPAQDLDGLLQQGEIDGYVAYTGTVLSIVAKEEVSGLDPDETYAKAKAFYDTRSMVMSAKTPYENKDAIATTVDYAETHGLKSITDLGKLSSFTLGARPEFEKLYLGLKGLQDVYGLDNATFKAVPLGEQYQALDDGGAEAVNAFTTDPQLVKGDYQVLSDPKLLFGSQNAVLVVGQDDLKRVGGDTFLQVVDTVNARLTEDVMVGLNTEVTQGQSEVEVAGRFLEREGLTKPLGER